MKKAFLIITLTILLFNKVAAQERKNYNLRQLIQISKEMGFDPDLTVKIFAAMDLNRQSIDSLLKNRALQPPERQLKLRRLVNQRDSVLYSLISEDELKKLEKIRKKVIKAEK